MRDHHGSDSRSRRGGWLRFPVGVTAMALTLAGCASLGADGDDGGLLSGSGSDGESAAPVLQIVLAGGFVPMGYDFSRVPELTVYGDGRAITHGPQILIYPGPLLPNLQLAELDDADVAALVESAREAGLLGEAPEYGQPPVADAPTTFVTLTVDGETYTHAANALGFGDGTGADGELVPGDGEMSGLSDEERAARVALAEFVAGAHELVQTAGGTESYEIPAFGVFARPTVEAVPDDTTVEPQPGVEAEPGVAPEPGVEGEPGAAPEPGVEGEPGIEPELERQVLAWPLDVALAGAGECVLVDGADAETLREVLTDANAATLFEQDGVRYETFFRPLLPHEDGCDDLI